MNFFSFNLSSLYDGPIDRKWPMHCHQAMNGLRACVRACGRALSNKINYNTRNKELNFEDIHVLFFMSHAFIMHCLSLREHDERDESRREREQYRLTEPTLLVVFFCIFSFGIVFLATIGQ
jgi:hypothetical protein